MSTCRLLRLREMRQVSPCFRNVGDTDCADTGLFIVFIAVFHLINDWVL